MADQPRSPGGDSGMGRDRGGGLPRWMKVLTVIVAIVVLLMVIMKLLGGGFGGHGP